MMVRILIVEDQPGMSGDLKTFLESETQARIASTHERQHVLTRVEQFKPVLIMLISQLARERGMAILQSLRESGLSSQVPIFIITSVTDRAVLKEAIQWKINEIFLKPLNKSLLLERIKKWAPDSGEVPATPISPAPAKAAPPALTVKSEPIPEGDFNARMAMARQVVSKMLASEKLQMPVLPEIAMQVQKRLQDPLISLEDIAEMIKPDVAIASKILSVANSSYYGAKEKIRDLNAAVIRIGLREIQNIIQMVCGHQLFQVPQPNVKQFMQKLWEHSLSCAYANHLVAQKKGLPEADQYFLLGLLHDIGKVFLIHLVSKAVEQDAAKGRLFTDEVIADLIHRMHNPLGEMIMKKWNYPSVFTEVALRHNDEVERICINPALAATCYANLITRKLGYSVKSFEAQEEILEKVSAYLGLTPEETQEIEAEIVEILQKVKGSFFTLS